MAGIDTTTPVRIDPMGHPRRIVVVGCCGAGKTTLTRALSQRWNLTHIQRDDFDHPDDPTDATPLVQRSGVLAAIDAAVEGWILDAAPYWYEDEIYPRADLIIGLDYAKPIVLWRCIKRTLGNILAGRETPLAFLSKDHAIRWALTVYSKRRREIGALADRFSTLIVFRSPRAARRWLKSTKTAPESAGGTARRVDGSTGMPYLLGWNTSPGGLDDDRAERTGR